MELLLWLYLYDHRWLFNLNIEMRIYKLLWLLPICLHFAIMLQGIIFFYLEQSIEPLLHILFSGLVCITIILFIFKINKEEKLHNAQQIKVTKIFKSSPHFRLHRNNFWIRKHSVFSFQGIVLLILSVLSLIWSYCISSTYQFTYSHLINLQPVDVFELQALIVFYGNTLFIFIATSLINIKLFFYVTSSICPRLHSHIANFIHNKKSRLVIHYPGLQLLESEMCNKSGQM